jgi:hypothetical protein
MRLRLLSINGNTFRGSVTCQEFKHVDYKDCLGFKDFDNFEGVRFGYSGVGIIEIKVSTPINVDELYHVLHFDFKRKPLRLEETTLIPSTAKSRVSDTRVVMPDFALRLVLHRHILTKEYRFKKQMDATIRSKRKTCSVLILLWSYYV